MNKSVEDCLIIGVDFSPNDKDYLVVTRRDGDKTYIINKLTDDEAVEIYNKLIGKEKSLDYVPRWQTTKGYEEVYDYGYDTAGNYHMHGVFSGHTVIKINNDNT